jgi:hypothetical protein
VEDGSADQVKADHTMSVRQVLSEWLPEGFVLLDLRESLPSQHLFVFGRAGDDTLPQAIETVDLLDGLADGAIEGEATGSGGFEVVVKVRRRRERSIVVTMETGTTFVAGSAASSMMARRDGALLLEDDAWHGWKIPAVRVARERPPESSVRLEPRRASEDRMRQSLVRTLQAGVDRSGRNGEIEYPARSPEIEQAAIWILDGDVGYGEMLPEIATRRIQGPYAAAFALVYCDLAGVDVTARRVWEDAPAIFAGVSDEALTRWYRSRSLDLRRPHDLARARAHVSRDDAEVDPRLFETQNVLAQRLSQR